MAKLTIAERREIRRNTAKAMVKAKQEKALYIPTACIRVYKASRTRLKTMAEGYGISVAKLVDEMTMNYERPEVLRKAYYGKTEEGQQD